MPRPTTPPTKQTQAGFQVGIDHDDGQIAILIAFDNTDDGYWELPISHTETREIAASLLLCIEKSKARQQELATAKEDGT